MKSKSTIPILQRKSSIGKFVYTFIIMFAIWLAFTTSFEPAELITGVFVSLIIAFFTDRIFSCCGMKVLMPHKMIYFIQYFFVFLFALIKANFDVAKRVISPKLPINPGIEYIKAKMVAQDGGRPRPVAIEGTETIYKCDTIIGAIGQQADYTWLPEKYKEDLIIERGKIQVNDLRQTGIAKIFAGGDSVKYGNSDAISAIADGFNAVKGIDNLLVIKN